jgi:hypothetical protein
MCKHLGLVTTVDADEVRLANPPGFPERRDFARIARVTIKADVMAYVRSRQIVFPEIALDRPEVQALQTADGKDNYSCHYRVAQARRSARCTSMTAKHMS